MSIKLFEALSISFKLERAPEVCISCNFILGCFSLSSCEEEGAKDISESSLKTIKTIAF